MFSVVLFSRKDDLNILSWIWQQPFEGVCRWKHRYNQKIYDFSLPSSSWFKGGWMDKEFVFSWGVERIYLYFYFVCQYLHSWLRPLRLCLPRLWFHDMANQCYCFLLFCMGCLLFFLWILLKIYKGEYDRSCAWIIINLGGLIICRNQHLRGLPLSRYRKSLIFGNYHLDVGSLRPNFYHVILWSLIICRSCGNYHHLGSLIICRNQPLQGLPLSRYRKSLIFGNYHHLGSLIICGNQHLHSLPLSRYRKSLHFQELM